MPANSSCFLQEFIDIVLSKTQRQTPTVIHPCVLCMPLLLSLTHCFRQYMISMIRGFYIRKIRFTQQTYHDKLSAILTEVCLPPLLSPYVPALV